MVIGVDENVMDGTWHQWRQDSVSESDYPDEDGDDLDDGQPVWTGQMPKELSGPVTPPELVMQGKRGSSAMGSHGDTAEHYPRNLHGPEKPRLVAPKFQHVQGKGKDRNESKFQHVQGKDKDRKAWPYLSAGCGGSSASSIQVESKRAEGVASPLPKKRPRAHRAVLVLK